MSGWGQYRTENDTRCEPGFLVLRCVVRLQGPFLHMLQHGTCQIAHSELNNVKWVASPTRVILQRITWQATTKLEVSRRLHILRTCKIPFVLDYMATSFAFLEGQLSLWRRCNTPARVLRHAQHDTATMPRKGLSSQLLLPHDVLGAGVAGIDARGGGGDAPAGPQGHASPGHLRPLPVPPRPEVLRGVQAALEGVRHVGEPLLPVVLPVLQLCMYVLLAHGANMVMATAMHVQMRT